MRAFLQRLEEERGCGVATRNQRLAAIRSLANFVGINSPQHVCWCGEIRAIPFKKAPQAPVTYLDKEEMDALLDATKQTTTLQGSRDHAVLLFLYNTGARADEVAHVLIQDLHLGTVLTRDSPSVTIRGKGNKLRQCPLWPSTAKELINFVANREPDEHVFLNRRGSPLTRFGIHGLVRRCVNRVVTKIPSLSTKRISPHTIRHTTAMHLLRAGVDINTIRAWLGHASLSTTNVYAEADLEMKAEALSMCEVDSPEHRKPWRKDPDLMAFLQDL